MNRYDLGTFILTAIAIILSLTIHEYSHALISTVQGDETPKNNNRLTLNPFSHVDLFGLISLFLFKFGWAKPVPINPLNYKNQRLGVILTSFAGPLSNLLLSFIAAIVYFKFQPVSFAVIYFLKDLMLINVGLAVFNMLPFPPS